MRLVTAVLVEQHDEWAIADRRYLSKQSMAQLAATMHHDPREVTATSLLTA